MSPSSQLIIKRDIVKKCKFCNSSHFRGKCSAWGKSCLNCNRKKHFKVCCPLNRKKVLEIEQTEAACEESSDIELFVKTNSIQDPLNINEIKTRTLFGQLLSPPADFQFRIKLILAHNVTQFHSKSTKSSIHSLISILWI